MPVSYQNLNETDLKDPRGTNINKRNRELVNEVNRLGGLNGPVAILNGVVLGMGKGTLSTGSATVSGAVTAASGTVSGALTAGSIATNGDIDATGDVTATGAVVAASVTLGIAPNIVQIIVGSGFPEGIIAAPVGSLYLNVGPSGANTLYVKQGGGATNQGWSGK